MTTLTTCLCCHQPLDTYQPPPLLPTQAVKTMGTCRTPDCRRINITRELAALAALSEDEVERYLEASRRSAAILADLGI